LIKDAAELEQKKQ